MPIIRIIDKLCALVNELEAAGVPEPQLERLDRLIDNLVAMALPTLAANGIADDLCPTCGGPLVGDDSVEVS